MDSLPRIGQIVLVRVTRVTSGGLFVDVVGSGARGIVRRRELAAAADNTPDEWQQRHPVGSEARALVVDHREGGRLELSLRQVRQDPWCTIRQTLHDGKLVEGVVTNVETYGAFVELPQGVTGLLHASRLPPWLSGAMVDLFWPGDRVKVIVDSLDESERRIGLTMQGLTEQRWRSVHENTQDAQARPVPSIQAAHEEVSPPLPIELLLEHAPLSILVVEDDLDHGSQLANWLRRAGQNVKAAATAEEALVAAAEFRPEVALVDLGLPDMRGAELVRRLLDLLPDLYAIMMTADFDHDADARDLESKGCPVLLKPLSVHEMYELLLQKRRAPAPAPEADTHNVVAQPLSPFSMGGAGPGSIPHILNSLVNQIRARKAIVFAVDLVQPKVEIAAQVGHGGVETQALPGLIRSPVRDVAEDELTVFTDDAGSDEARFRYLMKLLPFESCIGTPISANMPARMALFVFHSRRSAFASSDRELVAAAAYAIASVLERQLFLEQASDLQRLALLGQLSRALVHEINHRLSPVDFALDTLQTEFRDLERMIARLPQADALEFNHTEREFYAASQSLNSLAQAVRALIQTARLFGRMARTEHEAGMLVLSEAAIEVADLLRDSAHKQHVTIHVDLPDRLTATRTQSTLVRQVLINVVLNAIQQIGICRPREGGQVRIAVGERWDGDQRLVYFRVEDDGPGIHRRMWNQIFQLGYTTRKDGSGLGLHISRSLMESLGGRVVVQDSHLCWGTVFLIELPLQT